MDANIAFQVFAVGLIVAGVAAATIASIIHYDYNGVFLESPFGKHIDFIGTKIVDNVTFEFIVECNLSAEALEKNNASDCVGWAKDYGRTIGIVTGRSQENVRRICNHEMYHLNSNATILDDHVYIKQQLPQFQTCDKLVAEI